MSGSRAGRAAALLFAVTAALFAIAVSLEPDDHDETTETHSEATGTEDAHDEAAEGEEGHEATEAEAAHDEDETVLGIDVESPATVAFAVIGSLLLAAALWFRPLRPVAVLAVASGLAFAALDLAEVAHQLDESSTGLAALAAAIAIGHAAAAITSGLATRPALHA